MSAPTRPANASTSLPAITSAKRGTGAPSASRRRRITSLSWWIRADGGSATRAPDQMSPERHPGPALDGRSVTKVLAGAQASAAAQGYTADDGVLSTAPLGHRRRTDGQTLGGIRGGCLPRASRQSGPVGAETAQADRELHQGLTAQWAGWRSCLPPVHRPRSAEADGGGRFRAAVCVRQHRASDSTSPQQNLSTVIWRHFPDEQLSLEQTKSSRVQSGYTGAQSGLQKFTEEVGNHQ